MIFRGIEILFLLLFCLACATPVSQNTQGIKGGQGKTEVKRTYWVSGTSKENVKDETSMVNGIRHGFYKKYFPGGRLAEEGHYQDDALQGLYKTYLKTAC